MCFLFRKLRCQDIFIKIKSINIKFKITYISNFPASFSAEFPYLPDKKIVAGNSKNSFCRSLVYFYGYIYFPSYMLSVDTSFQKIVCGGNSIFVSFKGSFIKEMELNIVVVVV